jgi:His/Glu/Gln/Arg/opine family amino acid ABC transporter permease subunit
MAAMALRRNRWVHGQNTVSVAIFFAGAASLGIALVGSIFLIWVGGVVPFQDIHRTINSVTQGGVLVLGLVGRLAAVGSGAATYKRMPTKQAREAAVAGAVLGVQAVLFSAVYLWFRRGDTFTFVRNFLDFGGLAQYVPEFLNGAKVTIFLAVVSEAAGIVLGLTLALLAMSKRKVVRAPARVYINFFRGTPLLWQLSFGFFGLVLGLRLDLTPYQAGIVILSLNAAGYTAEIFRSGIQSIERGQREAARSLGMTYLQSMRYVIIPQAFRRVIPPLTNEFIILIKDTSLLAILGVADSERELLKVARDLYADTFNATPFLMAAAGYLAVTLPLFRFVAWLEKRLRSGALGVGAL